MLNKKRDEIQQKALKAWLKANKTGTCEIITGLGKTFIALHALYTMPRDDGKIHLFLAEQRDRVKDLREQIVLYNKIFERNVLEDYRLHFYCYQTVFKWKARKDIGLVIADEIHDSLSPQYSQFYFNNDYDAIIGLSATIDKYIMYNEEENYFTKGELLDKIAPICFKYGVDKGQKDKTARELEVNVIYHELDKVDKYIKGGTQRKPFYQTEEKAYNYWSNRHSKAWWLPSETEEENETKNREVMLTAYKRKNILYRSKSKVKLVKELLKHIHTPTILFGNSLDALLAITPNVVSSRNSNKKNDEIRQLFEEGKINLIGSFKKLKQGANLSNLDNCVIMSYYGNNKDLIQRIGRLRKADKKGKVFIIVTKDTQEEKWFKNMLQGSQHLNINYYVNLNDYLKN